MTQISDETRRDIINQLRVAIDWALDAEGDPHVPSAKPAVLAMTAAIGALTAAVGAAPDHGPDAGKMVGAPEPEIDLRPWGWEPGGYLNKCGACQQQHSGTDKRSWRCRACAIAARDATAPAAPAAEAVTGRDEWQPIETAPKDGTWVLGWAQSDSAPYRISWGRNHDGRLAWSTTFCSFASGYLTHWRPLPAPPATIPAVAEVGASVEGVDHG